MAQAIANSLLGDKIYAESAGLETADGMRATREAIRVMREKGYDISNHISRSVDSISLDKYDIIIPMTKKIADDLRRNRLIDIDRLLTLDISDPYDKGLEEYRRCAEQLTEKLLELFSPNINRGEKIV